METREQPRKIGRPPLPQGEARTVRINVRFRPNEAALVRRLAEARGMSISALVVAHLPTADPPVEVPRAW